MPVVRGLLQIYIKVLKIWAGANESVGVGINRKGKAKVPASWMAPILNNERMMNMPKKTVEKGNVRMSFWMRPETRNNIEKMYKEDNCSTRNEFCERAIEFYLGYISADRSDEYISRTLLMEMKGMLSEFENKISRALYKNTVEVGVMNHLLAAYFNIDDDYLKEIREQVVAETKRTNGVITLAKARVDEHEECKLNGEAIQNRLDNQDDWSDYYNSKEFLKEEELHERYLREKGLID